MNNYFNEIIICMQEQGYEPFIIMDKVYVKFEAYFKARQIVDKL